MGFIRRSELDGLHEYLVGIFREALRPALGPNLVPVADEVSGLPVNRGTLNIATLTNTQRQSHPLGATHALAFNGAAYWSYVEHPMTLVQGRSYEVGFWILRTGNQHENTEIMLSSGNTVNSVRGAGVGFNATQFRQVTRTGSVNTYSAWESLPINTWVYLTAQLRGAGPQGGRTYLYIGIINNATRVTHISVRELRD